MATAPAPMKRGERDATADLARWPVDHLHDCPAATDPELAAASVEFWRDRRITTKKVPHDVTIADDRPAVAVMVAHCCLCGGVSYHDLGG